MTGEAAKEIVAFAAREQIDLIVIATHGLTGWRHFLTGSVAEKVVRLAPCAVLTIRAPGRKAGKVIVELHSRVDLGHNAQINKAAVARLFQRARPS